MLTAMYVVIWYCRFSCVPVDFEVVNVTGADDDLSNAITAIRRNGVALKGINMAN